MVCSAGEGVSDVARAEETQRAHRVISLVKGNVNLAPGPSSSSSEASGLGDESGVPAASVANAAEPFCAGRPSPTVLRDETWRMNQSC